MRLAKCFSFFCRNYLVIVNESDEEPDMQAAIAASIDYVADNLRVTTEDV